MSITGFFKSKSSVASDNSKKGNLRQVLSKISGAFMLPISVMSIAGLFLGVGAAIASNSSASGAIKFGNLIQALGDPVFSALPLLFAIAFVIAFTDEAGVAVFATIIGYLVFVAVQQVFITVNKTETEAVILFEGGGRGKAELVKIVGKSLGFTSLQTSVFGGIAVGMFVQFLYNKFHTIQLPQIISFFGGKRFVALVTIPAMALLAFVFLIFWPWVGVVLNKFGALLGQTPYGFDSLIFGYIERSLIPFGLHHVFYAPLWYTSVGGDAGATIEAGLKAAAGDGVIINGANTAAILKDYAADKSAFQGDSTAALKLLKYGNFIDYTLNGKEVKVPLFTFLQNNGMKIGRFADGKFSGMMFGLPAAAAAMVVAAPKENRKVALGTVFPAALTSFMTGVTEPIEFTFLFLSPLLFWGFHAGMMAISFWLANLSGVHIPMAFSGGVLDMVLYGVVPLQKGTNFWWPLVIGLAYLPIYFFGFWFFIKWQNLETPGRGKTIKLFTKKDYLAAKDNKSKVDAKTEVDPQVAAIIEGYGGVDNIVAFNNCASRLRYDIKDLSKVSEEKLKAAGAVAIKVEGTNHVQAIMGPVAEQLNSKIKSQISLIKPEKTEAPAEVKNEDRCNEIKLYSPAKGTLVDLAQVQDGVFSDKLLGDGFAIKVGETGKVDIYSPINGKVTVAYPTKHAFGIISKCGKLSLLIHIGVDTVKLDGLGFTSFVDVDQEVKQGDKLSTVDLDTLKANGISKTDVIVVALSESEMKNVILNNEVSSVDQNTLVGKVL